MPTDSFAAFAMSPATPSDLSWTAPAQISLAIESSPPAVSAGLDEIVRHPTLAGIDEEEIGALWNVLAEVLNNVVEHAYAEGPGTIRLKLWRIGTRLAGEVTDRGVPMPGLQAPEGILPATYQPAELPEGNFGWFLIRALTDCVAYERLRGTNRLRFSIAAA